MGGRRASGDVRRADATTRGPCCRATGGGITFTTRWLPPVWDGEVEGPSPTPVARRRRIRGALQRARRRSRLASTWYSAHVAIDLTIPGISHEVSVRGDWDATPASSGHVLDAPTWPSGQPHIADFARVYLRDLQSGEDSRHTHGRANAVLSGLFFLFFFHFFPLGGFPSSFDFPTRTR